MSDWHTYIKRLDDVVEKARAARVVNLGDHSRREIEDAEGAFMDTIEAFKNDMSEALRRCEGACSEARSAASYADTAKRQADEALERAELARIALVKLFDPASADAIAEARERDRKGR